MNFLLYDTETTGLPDYKAPSNSDTQPHIVSIGAILADAHGEEVDRLYHIIRPDGWQIPEETIAIHGITMERAMDEGIPADEAIHNLLAMQARAQVRAAFNVTFDNRILRIALYRHARAIDPTYGHGIAEFCLAGEAPAIASIREEVADWWQYGVPDFCVMKAMQDAMGVRKYPKLAEAYYYAMEREMPNAHSAIDDAHHARELLQWLLDHQRATFDAGWFASKAAHKASKAAEKRAARADYLPV